MLNFKLDIKKRRVLGVIGRRTKLIRRSNLTETLHVALLTDLTKELPFYLFTHSHINSGEDFFNFLEEAVHQGYLASGDILVLDNAATHFSKKIRDAADKLLIDANV